MKSLALIIVTLAVCFGVYRSGHTPSFDQLLPASVGQESALPFGNISKDGTDPNNFLIELPEFTISYNRSRRTPNWVAWTLKKSHIGAVERGEFIADKEYKSLSYSPSKYAGSGFDMGHIIPSADRTNSIEANQETFRFPLNVAPQAPECNRGVWADFEKYCRKVLVGGRDVYQVAGIFGGAGQIGKTVKITVPKRFWKLSAFVPVGDTLAEAKAKKRLEIICLWVPNDASVKGTSWRDYRIPPEELAEKTGYHFILP